MRQSRRAGEKRLIDYSGKPVEIHAQRRRKPRRKQYCRVIRVVELYHLRGKLPDSVPSYSFVGNGDFFRTALRSEITTAPEPVNGRDCKCEPYCDAAIGAGSGLSVDSPGTAL